LIRKRLTGLIVVGALAGAAWLGPWWVQQVTPRELGALLTGVDALWWPATVLRGGVYALLAWGVYPRWVQGRIRRNDPERVRQQSPLVFGAFCISDLVIAQLPYGLLR
jgi:hypothetical protein